MKLKLTSKIAATLAAVALASPAQAALINGRIDFTGAAVLGPPGFNLTTATEVSSWSGLSASQASGDFSPVVTPTEAAILGDLNLQTKVTITSPWQFNSPAIQKFWLVGPTLTPDWGFDLTSSVKNPSSTPTFLDVSGTGFAYGLGANSAFTKTPGTWTFNITSGANNTGSFSFQSATNAVPDGGTTVSLLGLSFLGLGGVSRLLRRK